MKKLFCIAIFLSSSFAYTAVLPAEGQLRKDLSDLEDHVYDELIFLGGGELYKTTQKKFYFNNLHSKFLEQAGKIVEVQWVIDQIKALFKMQLDRVGLQQMDYLAGSIKRRIDNVDGKNYLPKLFEILFSDEADRIAAKTAWVKAQKGLINI